MTNFCTSVEVHYVITSANFYDSRLWGFGVVGGGHILASPLNCVIGLTTMRICDRFCHYYYFVKSEM